MQNNALQNIDNQAFVQFVEFFTIFEIVKYNL